MLDEQLSNNLVPEDFPSLQELDKDSKTSFSFRPIPYWWSSGRRNSQYSSLSFALSRVFSPCKTYRSLSRLLSRGTTNWAPILKVLYCAIVFFSWPCLFKPGITSGSTTKVNHISSSGRLQRTILDWQLQTLKLFPDILFTMEEGKWAGSLAPLLNLSKPIDIQSSSSPDDIWTETSWLFRWNFLRSGSGIGWAWPGRRSWWACTGKNGKKCFKIRCTAALQHCGTTVPWHCNTTILWHCTATETVKLSYIWTT